MNEAIISSVIDKVDEQQRTIQEQQRAISELKEKVKHSPDNTELLSLIKTGIEKVQTGIGKISFPEKEVQELSKRLFTTNELLTKPVKQEVVQRHHVPKLIWITAILFLILCLTVAGWYQTYKDLDQYEANDTKYRYMKIKANGYLSKVLGIADSLYRTDPQLRESVIAIEEQNQKDFEKMQKAFQMERDAKELKKQVQNSGKKKR